MGGKIKLNLQELQKAQGNSPGDLQIYQQAIRQVPVPALPAPRVEFISATEVGFLFERKLITKAEARAFLGLIAEKE